MRDRYTLEYNKEAELEKSPREEDLFVKKFLPTGNPLIPSEC